MALGWQADWRALLPLTLIAAWPVLAHLPRIAPTGPTDANPVVWNRVVLGTAFVAALTFAVMIGTFFIAEQRLQRAAGYSALGASTVLMLVALLVGAAMPVAGRFSDRHGERLPATAGFFATAIGLLVLGLPSVPLRHLVTLAALVPVGLGLDMLFVPVSRAALNAIPAASHGRASAVLSIERLAGAAAGAVLAGVALAGGPNSALLVACAGCLLVGIPACTLLGVG